MEQQGVICNACTVWQQAQDMPPCACPPGPPLCPLVDALARAEELRAQLTVPVLGRLELQPELKSPGSPALHSLRCQHARAAFPDPALLQLTLLQQFPHCHAALQQPGRCQVGANVGEPRLHAAGGGGAPAALPAARAARRACGRCQCSSPARRSHHKDQKEGGGWALHGRRHNHCAVEQGAFVAGVLPALGPCIGAHRHSSVKWHLHVIVTRSGQLRPHAPRRTAQRALRCCPVTDPCDHVCACGRMGHAAGVAVLDDQQGRWQRALETGRGGGADACHYRCQVRTVVVGKEWEVAERWCSLPVRSPQWRAGTVCCTS